jgi:hypothetical protein
MVHSICSVVIGVRGVLVGGAGLLIGRANAILSILIDFGHLTLGVLDLLTVLGGLLSYLVHFGLNRSRGILHVFFSRASGGEHSARYDTRGSKENSHGQKTSVSSMQFVSLPRNLEWLQQISGARGPSGM